MGKNTFDVVIIGGGPAGISAALWCDELGLDAILLESGPELGGQLNWTFNPIGNYLGVKAANGKELRDRFLRQIESRKTKFRKNAIVIKIDFDENAALTAEGETFQYQNLIIATGVRRRTLDVIGEKEFIGKGVLFSGKRDRNLVRGKSVIVVGGGDAAFENVQILSEVASNVRLIHRGNEFRARDEFFERVKNDPNVEVITNSVITKLSGNDRLESATVSKIQTDEIIELKTDFLLSRIGVDPNTNLVSHELDLDPKGYIQTDALGTTSLDNVFAVGDVANYTSPTIQSATGMAATATKAINSVSH